MNDRYLELIQAAETVFGEFSLREDFSAGSCAAAIRTSAGNIYTGICIDLSCGLGFCAEVAAMAEMLKHRETHIVACVAIAENGVRLAPCGRCRETMVQIDPRNFDCHVLLPDDKETTIRDLLPGHWLDV